MMTPEGKVKAKVKELLKQYGCYQYWPVTNGMGAPSLDCIGWIDGEAFAIETKTLGKKPTPRQEVTMRAMREAGAQVFVVDGSELSVLVVRSWLETVKCL